MQYSKIQIQCIDALWVGGRQGLEGYLVGDKVVVMAEMRMGVEEKRKLMTRYLSENYLAT